ncbi:MAG: hypothetical protein HY966_03105, partial [Ignavibacteriales bacterium]|nr:hypothetical protein [Ignavibacteriales bacterium]
MAFFFAVLTQQQSQRNYWLHIIEGALYSSSGAFFNIQTVLPALFLKLGASSFVLGCLPVIAYLGLFTPQLLSARYALRRPMRKSIVIKGGLIQRLQLFLLAVVIALFANAHSSLALAAILAVFLVNQLVAGWVSPVWYDFLAKTVTEDRRSSLAGNRTVLSALLGLMNGALLAWILPSIQFPYDFATIVFL